MHGASRRGDAQGTQRALGKARSARSARAGYSRRQATRGARRERGAARRRSEMRCVELPRAGHPARRPATRTCTHACVTHAHMRNARTRRAYAGRARGDSEVCEGFEACERQGEASEPGQACVHTSMHARLHLPARISRLFIAPNSQYPLTLLPYGRRCMQLSSMLTFPQVFENEVASAGGSVRMAQCEDGSMRGLAPFV